jgi:hypothetical protein
MRKACASVVICVAVVAGCGGTKWSSSISSPTSVPTNDTTPARAIPRGWVAYRDPTGLTLQHPPAWTIQPGQLGPVIVFIDRREDAAGVRRNINVLSQALPTGMTAAQYLRLSMAQVAQVGGKLDDTRETDLSGFAARRVIWHLSKNGLTIRFLSVWTVRARYAYIVTYTSDDAGFDAPISDVNRLIASIRLPPSA